MEKLLAVRKKAKSRKPNFVRQDVLKKPGLGKGWRRPKGLQSKLRYNKRGKGKNISSGYRSPRAVRGLDGSGKEMVTITNSKDLEGLDIKKHSLLLSSTLGNKKRIQILKKAKELGLKVLNFKNPDEFVKKVEDILVSKKKSKEFVKKEAEKKKETKKEEKLAEKVDGETKKEGEKKEKDKLLTQRER